MTSLLLYHRPNAIRVSHVRLKPGTSKPFISGMGPVIMIVTCDKILTFLTWMLSIFQIRQRLFAWPASDLCD